MTTITAFHESLKNKKTSAREAVAFCFENIKKENKTLNAFLEMFEEDAMASAFRIDEEIAHGATPGVLWGVPIAVKDNILVKGKRASAGSKVLEKYVASYDATVISRLKNAGAIIVGRTNMDEFAMGSSTENSAYGHTKNPYDHTRVPGGSSGGSAVAVATDMAYAALGSETGGSVRQPAAFCGLVGLKPTYGAVSRFGLMAMASSLDQVAPFAKTVADTEIIFNAIKGKDPLDATSVDRMVSEKPIRTIGIVPEHFTGALDPRIKDAIMQVVERLKEKYEVREISMPHLSLAVACYYVIVPAEVSSNMARYDGVRYGARKEGADLMEVYKKSRGVGLGPEVTRRVLLGTYVLSHGYYDAYYGQAQKVRSLIRHDFENAFSGVDVILTPTTPTLPFKAGEKSHDPLAMYLSDMYTIPAHLAGVPAFSVPAGWAEEDGKKLPIGLQLMAPWFAEDRLFSLGKEIYTAT